MRYYELRYNGQDAFTLSPHNAPQALAQWRCEACKGVMRWTAPVNIIVQGDRPRLNALNMIWGADAGAIHHDFAEALGREVVEAHLLLGSMRTEEGKLLDRWSTFIGRHRLIVRGSREVSWRRCEACGRVCYFALGKRYLFPAPDPLVKIFHAGGSELVVTEDIYARLSGTRWRGLGIRELPVVTTPADGLGELK